MRRRMQGARVFARRLITSIPGNRSHRITRLSGLVFVCALIAAISPAAEGPAVPYSHHVIATDGDVAVVGAPWQSGYAGAAWVLERDGDSWRVVQALSPDDLGRHDHYGASVAIDGDVIAVGAPWQNRSDGAVYVFRRDGAAWTQDGKLILDDPAPGMRLGSTLALSDGVVTASAGGGRGVAVGIAGYRFERDGDAWRGAVQTAQPAPAPAPDSRTAERITAVLNLEATVDAGPSAAPAADPVAPDSVRATDGIHENRIEVRWWGDSGDAIVYRIEREGELVSVASSDDAIYVDYSNDVDPGTVYEYCVIVEDMASNTTTPECDDGHRRIFPPYGVTASDGDSTSCVHIEWNDVSRIEQGYYIRRGTELIDSTGANAWMYEDVTADVGTVYEYSVSAFDADGRESIAKVDEGWRGAVLPPIEVSASDGQFPNHIVVSWKDQTPNETGFNVYRIDAVDTLLVHTAGPMEGTGSEMSWDDTSITPGEQYTYCVTATAAGSVTDDGTIISHGNKGPWPTISLADGEVESRRVCDDGRTGMDAPTNVAASDSTYDDRVRITWEDNSDYEDGYEVSRGGSVIDTTRANATVYDDYDAPEDQTLAYTVRAISRDGGVSGYGTDDGFRSIVLAPYEVAATEGDYEEYTEITWKSNSTTAVLFKIFRDGEFIKSVNSADRMYRDTGGVAGVDYDYTVVAMTAQTHTATSGADAGRRELLVPTQLTVSNDAYENKTTLTWTDNSRMERGYVVTRQDTVSPATITLDTPGDGRAVAAAGHYAYVADGASGLQIVDVSDLSQSEIVGNFTGSNPIYGVDAVGRYAYVAANVTGLQVLDISNPSTPTLLDSVPALAQAYNVVVAGGYAYVANYQSVLEIIDVSDPHNLSRIAQFNTDGYTYGIMAVEGDYVFVSTDYPVNGIQIIDVSDPANPAHAGAWLLEDVTAIAATGSHVYLGADSTLQIVDVTDPAATALVGSMTLPASVANNGITVSGDKAFICAGSSLLIVDISDPGAPALQTALDTSGSPRGTALYGNYAYVANGTAGLWTLRLSSVPETTHLGAGHTSHSDKTGTPGVSYLYSVSAFDSTGTAEGRSAAAEGTGRRKLRTPTNISVDKGEYEKKVVVRWRDNSDWEDGYRIYRDGSPIGTDDDDQKSFEDTSPVFGQHHYYEVRAYDNHGESAADADSGFTTLLAPVSVSASTTYDDRIELTWVDRSSIEDGFKIYRGDQLLATLNEPDRTSYTDIRAMVGNISPMYAYGVTVAGSYAYVAASTAGLVVLDISDPAQPTPAGSYNTSGMRAYEVAIDGDYAYVAGGDSLWILDVTSSTPTFVGSCPATQAVDVAVSGNYAYVADGDGLNMLVVDVSNAAAPGVVGTYTVTENQYYWVNCVAVSGGYVYIGCQSGGYLRILDVSNPAAPTLRTTIEGWNVKDVAVVDGYVYMVQANSTGMEIYDIHDPLNPEYVGTYPGYRMLSVSVSGNTAYVGEIDLGVSVVDVSDRSNPRLVEIYSTTSTPNGVDASGAYIYLACSNGLHAISPPVLSRGTSYSYCVSAYKDTVLSERGCGDAWIPDVNTREANTVEANLKLLAGDGGASDQFGQSVAISGDWAIVGAPNQDSTLSNQGAAYFYERDSDGAWTQKQDVTGSADTDANFGWSVAIDGDCAVVGSYRDHVGGTVDAGSAWIYERDADGVWQYIKYIYGSDKQANDHFGASVAISGDWIVVGADYDDSERGTAYVFQRSGGVWPTTQTDTLRASDGVAGDKFGASVAIHGDRFIVGAPYATAGNIYGAAYVFELDGGAWTQVAKLPGEGRTGSSVAIAGDWALVGAPYYSDYVPGGAGHVAGRARVYRRDATGAWNDAGDLMASDAVGGDHFGVSVAISDRRLIVGSGQGQYPTYGVGSAYVFGLSADGTWSEMQKIVAEDAAISDEFGTSVATDGSYAIIGARSNDDDGSASGSAYVVSVQEVADVVATDGTLQSRVRITWDDQSFDESGFRIYRDGEKIVDLDPNVEIYEDFDAEAGRTYLYTVTPLLGALAEEGQSVTDFGWRPANGSITGRITTVEGAPADSVWIAVTPHHTKSLLFDGVGGHVVVADETGVIRFDSTASYTVEAWFKYQGNGGPGAGDGTLISKTDPGFRLNNRRSSGYPGQLSFNLKDGATSASVATVSTNLNDNTWHHVVCVLDADTDVISIYIDGVFENSAPSNGAGAVLATDPLRLGASQLDDSWYGGQLDEVRIWNVARSAVDIAATMSRPLKGNEAGLVAYWPLNGGWGDDEDGIRATTDLTSNATYGTFADGVYWTDDCPELDIYAITDVEGNFVANRLYYGAADEFEIRPSAGTHQFDPTYKTVSLTTESPVENQVHFIDVSSFTVSGAIRFEGTSCAAVDVPIFVDDQPGGTTDSKGKFAVSMDEGWHWIRPAQEDRQFVPESLYVNVLRDTVINNANGVAFVDTTTHVLSGSLGGGCGREIGDVTITIRSENDCMLQTLSYPSGIDTYFVALPPQTYLVSASVDPQSIPDGLSKTDVTRFFQNLGVRVAEMDSFSVAMDFVYRAPLKVAITGFSEYKSSDCSGLNFEERTLPNVPVLPQGLGFKGTPVFACSVLVYEDYGPTNEPCPLDSGAVIIYDELADRASNPFPLIVRDGVAVCTTSANTPSLAVGRTDENGIDRSFQKAFTAVAYVEGRTPVQTTEWVLVTGHVAPEGVDFVTASVDVPLYILRDPPGDRSYAFLEKGHTLSTTIEWDETIDMWKGGVRIDIWAGLKIKWFVGLGAGTIGESEVGKAVETELLKGKTTQTMTKTQTVLTTKRTMSTSPEDEFVGGEGDVFVGAGYNFVFAEVGVVEVDGCDVVKSTSVGFEADTIRTVYAYTQDYISQILIPELDSKAEYYFSHSEPESAGYFVEMSRNWESLVLYNDSLKVGADSLRNHSFSAGADFSYEHESGETKSYTRTTTGTFDWDLSTGGFGYGGDSFGFYISPRVQHHHENLDLDEDTTGTFYTNVGYVLSDDDIGDHYTVTVKQDTVYDTPIFDVRAGASSCPYEAWPEIVLAENLDERHGPARMVPRDKPKLYVSPPQQDDVPAGEPATFTLGLENQSPFGESRLYVLRLLTNSNPYGAIVKVGGTSISNGFQQYYIDAGQTQDATLTVERGPRRYKYDDLQLILYPPCEYELWENRATIHQTDTLTFSVTFDAPCSDVTLEEPDPGWTFTRVDQDTGAVVQLLLADYELILGADTTDVVEQVGVQCRRPGVGNEGPTPWKDIVPPHTPDPDETLFLWTPQDSLADGVYELRAYTQCQGGFGYSEISTGTIERNGPVVLGSPEPADGELSLGEDISVTFNELIDCGSVIPQTTVTLTYVDGDNAGDTIQVETVCDERTIVIAPADGVDLNTLEGRSLQARVFGITDRAGNPLADPAVWEFYYRKSQFTWSQLHLTADVPYRNPGFVTAELANGTEEPVDYTITDMPGWVVSADPASGVIPPGETQLVSFAVADTTEGLYEGEVTATADNPAQGVAVFDMHVTIKCMAPAWIIDPARFEHTMNVVAELDIDDTLSMDVADRVAAFVGGQFRGVANIQHIGAPVDKYLAFLTVYSNRASGETVRFQVWDDSNCKRYNATDVSLSFTANVIHGTTGSPVHFNALDISGSGAVSIACNEGWTWISTNINSLPDMSVNSLLSDLTPSDGDVIKSQTQFSQAVFQSDPTEGWTWAGTLDSLSAVSSYMIRLTEPGTIIHTGPPVDINTPVPVDSGWSWIGYLPQGPKHVSDALANLDVAVNGDIIKGQTAFAERVGSYWYGSLDTLRVGEGYKLRLSGSSAKDTSFVYEPYSKTAAAPALVAELDVPEAAPAEGMPDWAVNPSAYQFNMTVTAVLHVGGRESIDERDLVGAFVGDECRGVASPVYVDGVKRNLAFLMVHTNAASGEKVTFRVFDADAGVVYDVKESLPCTPDAVCGSVGEPRVLTTSGVWGEDAPMPAVFRLRQNYPNPFNPTTTIRFEIPRESHVTLRIYNARGQEVLTAVDRAYGPGYHRFVWEGRNNNGQPVASGVYFYRLHAATFTDVKKMVLLR